MLSESKSSRDEVFAGTQAFVIHFLRKKLTTMRLLIIFRFIKKKLDKQWETSPPGKVYELLNEPTNLGLVVGFRLTTLAWLGLTGLWILTKCFYGVFEDEECDDDRGVNPKAFLFVINDLQKKQRLVHLQVPQYKHPPLLPVADRGELRAATQRSRGVPDEDEGPVGGRALLHAASSADQHTRRRLREPLPSPTGTISAANSCPASPREIND
ncbi:hypothetical protein NQ318_022512 [Aromia moschata]|uniref:Uncharacterized protein n=1 Tax=Aromia moschata TaxID=1265417 RepID=A0AAV8Z4Y5_9CUCU|nr:hypothetical protein NQ318_022512 [Aromia moschata]